MGPSKAGSYLLQGPPLDCLRASSPLNSALRTPCIAIMNCHAYTACWAGPHLPVFHTSPFPHPQVTRGRGFALIKGIPVQVRAAVHTCVGRLYEDKCGYTLFSASNCRPALNAFHACPPPPQRWSRLQTVIAYYGMGLHWGRLKRQNKKAHLIGHVKV